MKKSLFATALLVALVGCSKSADETMGAAAPAESGASASSSTEIRQETIVTNDPPIESSSSRTDVTIQAPDAIVTQPGQPNVIITPPAPAQGSAGGSVSADVDINTQPAQPAQPDQSQDQQQQPEQGANTTGDQSNGDTSNRPAGDPAGQQQQQPQQPE